MADCGVLAILFDLDNTLVDTAGAGKVAIHEVSELLKQKLGNGPNITDICEQFIQKLFKELFNPSAGLTIDEVRINHWNEALQEAGVDPDLVLASECYYTWKNTRLQTLSLPPDVLALLEKLRGSYKLLLLTNGDTQTQREKIKAVRCEELFDAVVVGGEHAEEKPAASIFTHCFELLGVKPQECIMVGDSLDTDIQGGINAGVRATVWINRKGASAPQTITPDYDIPCVVDLPTVLTDLRCSLLH